MRETDIITSINTFLDLTNSVTHNKSIIDCTNMSNCTIIHSPRKIKTSTGYIDLDKLNNDAADHLPNMYILNQNGLNSQGVEIINVQTD